MESDTSHESKDKNLVKRRLTRCMQWLQKQNSEEPKDLLQNKNDIQFIIQNNAERKKFLLSSANDVATVPAGVDEPPMEPKQVPIKRLRVDDLQMECQWKSCRWYFSDYEQFQRHVQEHIPELHVIDDKEYVCLWDVCGHKSSNPDEIVRHVNYHAYHGRLLAIGFNARATLNLTRCRKDSSKRNQVPVILNEHLCLWTECSQKYQSVQVLFNHVRQHCEYAEKPICSWAGCGAQFHRRSLLYMHVRSHTREKLIACYHCGNHFANNRKLGDHLLRQNVDSKSEHQCGYCGTVCGSAYLRREHERQHVSQHACSLCDMSAPTLNALAQHVRYRHLQHLQETRAHHCPHCDYRAVTKSDLKFHIKTHNRKKKAIKHEQDTSDDENLEFEEVVEKKPKVKQKRKYACHICPEDKPKIFTRGTLLTTHLVKMHEAQWPCGYSRFRYQICDDGMYRLTTTRYEFLEVSKKIVDGYRKDSITNSYDFDLELKAQPTFTTPTRFAVSLKNSEENPKEDSLVEITMCDVDDKGNIIKSSIFKSDVVYT